MRVWSKQHASVWAILQETGRYTVKKQYVKITLEEHAELVYEVYDWLVRKMERLHPRPDGADYPVWVSFARETTMLPDPDSVMLELEIPEEQILSVDINKWGTILNYSYIPADEEDSQAHQQGLAQYGLDDAQAYMSHFYPAIKRDIVASWDRLFDPAIVVNNRDAYGTVWELRREWVQRMTPPVRKPD